MRDAEADAEIIARIRGLLEEFRELGLPPAQKDQVTPRMRTLRSLPLDERIAEYQKDRIQNQLEWYANKANWNRKRADWYQFGLIAIELVAFGVAVFTAVSGFSVSAYAVLSALAVAGVGWLQIRQHRTTADAYALASHELAAIQFNIRFGGWRRCLGGIRGSGREGHLSRAHAVAGLEL